MSDWFEAEAEMTRMVTDEFGTCSCQVIPQIVPPNRRSQQDAGRPTYYVKGVFDWPWDRAIVHQTEAMEPTRSPTLFVHACDILTPTKDGDIVIIPYRGRMLIFSIIDIRRDGVSGIYWDLDQKGLQR